MTEVAADNPTKIKECHLAGPIPTRLTVATVVPETRATISKDLPETVARLLDRDLAPISPTGQVSRGVTQKLSPKLGEAPVPEILVLVAALAMMKMESLLGSGMMPMSGRTKSMEGAARMAVRSVNFPEMEVLETVAALAVLCQIARRAIVWLELLVVVLVREPFFLTLT